MSTIHEIFTDDPVKELGEEKVNTATLIYRKKAEGNDLKFNYIFKNTLGVTGHVSSLGLKNAITAAQVTEDGKEIFVNESRN